MALNCDQQKKEHQSEEGTDDLECCEQGDVPISNATDDGLPLLLSLLRVGLPTLLKKREKPVLESLENLRLRLGTLGKLRGRHSLSIG